MATESAGQRQPVSGGRLWFGMAASAAAWASLGFIDIIINWRACVHQEQSADPVSHSGIVVLYVVVAAILFLIVVTAGTTSYRNWRALSQQRELLQATATDRREFMALLGVFVSVTLGAGVIWLSIPPLVLHLCERAR